ncbi:MAG: alpha-N-acetylglucosaminidase [Chitinophagaceae bacterium]
MAKKKRHGLNVWCNILALGGCLFSAHAQQNNPADAARQLVARVLPSYADSFAFEVLTDCAKDSFSIVMRKDGRVLIHGNNGVSMASGFYTYLTDYCHANITWDSRQLDMPVPMPKPVGTVGKSSLYKDRYYLNYCTYNYSMSWWDWNRWQQEIDWMAMHGINMPLALTGEEAVWKEVYSDLGLSRQDLGTFFSGPAYFSWFWMGNLDGWNGPLSDNWMSRQRQLQQKILQRERELGMTPVLPAFTGHVPQSLRKHYPQAKIKNTNWDAGFEDVCILDAEDPLFDTIGRLFLKKQTEIYGTNHLYSADTFNENVPPSNDSSYLDGITKKIYATMCAVDSQAKWLMQGWMFHYNKAYWGEPQVAALLHAVPGDNLVILDLYSESHPMWQTSHSYYGKPWIWNMLQNFGGNIGLFGPMDAVAKEPYKTFRNKASQNMTGIGLAPEGIEQNPALFALMLQNVWANDTIDVPQFLKKYARNRYGVESPQLQQAWEILYRTVYQGGSGEGTPESIIVSHPMMQDSSQRVRTALNYEPKQLAEAWRLLLSAKDQAGTNDGYLYDLIDVTRQVLANHAFDLFQTWRADYQSKNWAQFQKHTQGFLTLMQDMDRLLASNRHFLLGKWIADARACGITPEEKNRYERNARDLVTLWGGRASGLSEYSNRQWAGLINGYYLPRWQMYCDYILQSQKTGKPIDLSVIDSKILDWEWDWVNDTKETYASTPVGNTLDIVQTLYKKYYGAVSR